ncbi:MAG: hypothetical protein KatS3mg124_1043 [Porticoccaceae bacterium]|nr:MAG: hypothetical protein KatS3mg124_1043 [Porticoccaceae bacterium]
MGERVLSWAADAVLLCHAAVAGFAVLVPVGAMAGWRWARDRRVGGVQLLLMAAVAGLAAAGRPCPLTVWEGALRRAAGEVPSGAGLVERGLEALLYWDLPAAAFTVLYLFWAGLSALLFALLSPPGRRRVES